MNDAWDRMPGGLALDIFDPAPVGVAVTSGPEHRLIYTNRAYTRIVGERRLGLPAYQAFGDLRQRSYFANLDQVLESGQPLTLREVPFEFGDRSGRERYCSISVSKISLNGGRPGLLIVTAELADPPGRARRIDPGEDAGRRYLQRYQSLLQVETHVVWVAGPQGQAVEPSSGLQLMTGQSWADYRGDGWQQALHPDDREAVRKRWAVALRDRSPLDHVYRLKTARGYRHLHSRGVPVIEDGVVVEWVGICVDIEQEWQNERHRRLLDQAAAATADVAELDEVLGMLARVIVPRVVDACGIYVIPDVDGRPPTPLVAERFVSVVREGLGQPSDPRTDRFAPDSLFVEAVRTRRPIRRTFPRGDPPPGVAPAGAEPWFRSSGANSMALVPVIVDGAVAAVVDAVICGERDPISAADVDLLSRMLDHAHAHLSNAMRFQRTQRVALALQHYLLPEPPHVPGMEITARYRPSATTADIGGDWYDSFLLPDGATILTIGDVAGHDLTAAVTMSQLRNMLRGLAMDRREPPGDILQRLNTATETLYPDRTATCILARLHHHHDTWHLHHSNAGHPPPLLITHDGHAHYLHQATDPLLGITGDHPPTSTRTPLPPRSTLLLYTDGLIELPGQHLDHGLERLRHHATTLADAPLDTFTDQLLARVPHTGKDDIAMIAVRLPER
jgi:PAS domain S-box-containing protein